MGAHICGYCNCEPCKCKKGEGRHKNKKGKKPNSKPGEKPLFSKSILSQDEVNALSGAAGTEFRDPQTVPSILDTPCGSCGKVDCDCAYKDSWIGHLADGNYNKATLAAQMEELGNPYRRMAKCVAICDKAEIEYPKWCKEALLQWAIKEVGDNERYMESA